MVSFRSENLSQPHHVAFKNLTFFGCATFFSYIFSTWQIYLVCGFFFLTLRIIEYNVSEASLTFFSSASRLRLNNFRLLLREIESLEEEKKMRKKWEHAKKMRLRILIYAFLKLSPSKSCLQLSSKDIFSRKFSPDADFLFFLFLLPSKIQGIIFLPFRRKIFSL